MTLGRFLLRYMQLGQLVYIQVYSTYLIYGTLGLPRTCGTMMMVVIIRISMLCSYLMGGTVHVGGD